MSKELATIEVHADITYDLQAARLTDIFTPEAYALCKEWEFKNLLGRFQIQASRNVAGRCLLTGRGYTEPDCFCRGIGEGAGILYWSVSGMETAQCQGVGGCVTCQGRRWAVIPLYKSENIGRCLSGIRDLRYSTFRWRKESVGTDG